MDRTKYDAALAADEAFTRELVRAYGVKNAGNARYKYFHDDAGVTAAAEAKLEADRAWREEMWTNA